MCGVGYSHIIKTMTTIPPTPTETLLSHVLAFKEIEVEMICLQEHVKALQSRFNEVYQSPGVERYCYLRLNEILTWQGGIDSHIYSVERAQDSLREAIAYRNLIAQRGITPEDQVLLGIKEPYSNHI